MKKTLIIFLFIPRTCGVRGGFSLKPQAPNFKPQTCLPAGKVQRIILFFLLGLGAWGLVLGTSFANSTKTDSLLQVLQTTIEDTTRIKTLNALAWKLMYTNPDTAIYYSKQALTLAEKAEWEKGIAHSYHNLGVFNDIKGNYTLALTYYNKALKIREQLKDKKGISASLGNIGVVYRNQGDYPKALEYYFKALKMDEELGNKNFITVRLSNIGIVYDFQSDYPKALEYYFKSLKMDEELGDKNGIAINLANIGSVYMEQGDYPKALDYYFKALRIMEELGNKNGIAAILGNIGNVYNKQGDYHKALDYYFKALKMKEELGAKSEIAITLGNIGALYTDQKKYPEAERYLLQALEIADSIGALNYKMHFENSISELYTKTRQYQKAYEHYKAYSIAKDTLYNEEKSKEIGKLEAGFEYDKKLALEQAEHEKQSAVAASESRRQKVVIYAVSGGLGLMLILAFLIYRGYRQKQKANVLLERKNATITRQKKEIEEKNKDITDSIRYAENIQKAILPPVEDIKKAFSDSFVLFKPKDIVSGDFYFYSLVRQTIILAACDCTGHGVPGAFMSMIGSQLLNEIVNDKSVDDAAEVVNQLRDGIIHAFGEAGATGEQKDGMDMALCAFRYDKDNGVVNVQYAGAYNPLYIVRSTNKSPLKGGSPDLSGQGGVDTSGTKSPDTEYQPAGDSSLRSAVLHSTQNDKFELIQIPADKQPVGFHYGEQMPFTNHNIPLRKGDTIYLFSDGYQDQFGGPRGKKFMSKRFRQLLLDIQEMSMEKQKEQLNKTIEEWKGNGEQVDDILVIGVRV